MGNLLSKGRILIAAGTMTALTIGGAYAFTAANTVPASKAGDGSGAVTGYTVSNIHYALDNADPTQVESVEFDVDLAPPAGATLKAQFVTSGNWYTCSATGTDVSCDTTSPALTVLPTNTVRVVLAQ